MLTLAKVAEKPDLLSFEVEALEGASLRPLTLSDVSGLTTFFESLSFESRYFFSLSEDLASEARSRCHGMGKYDKLRLVVDVSGRIVGIFEFSLDLVQDDIERYSRNGTHLVPESTIRFGRTRMILWGGVDVENKRAIGFYKNVGFILAGHFENEHGRTCLDMYRNL